MATRNETPRSRGASHSQTLIRQLGVSTFDEQHRRRPTRGGCRVCLSKTRRRSFGRLGSIPTKSTKASRPRRGSNEWSLLTFPAARSSKHSVESVQTCRSNREPVKLRYEHPETEEVRIVSVPLTGADHISQDTYRSIAEQCDTVVRDYFQHQVPISAVSRAETPDT